VFFPSDTTTEIVAHFLGYFQISVDDMRLRLAYEEAEAVRALRVHAPSLDQHSADIDQKFSLGSYAPGVSYAPPTWFLHGDAPVEISDLSPLVSSDIPHWSLPHKQGHPAASSHHSSHHLYVGPEPGSVIAVIAQTIVLSDNDFVNLGTYDGPLEFHSGADDAIPRMHAAATQVTGFVSDVATLNSIGDVPTLIEAVAQAAGSMANAPATADTSINVTDGLAEHYVNGAVVDQIPELADTLPAPWNSSLQQDNVEEDAAATEPVEHVTFAGDDVADLVTLKAGGNLLVNEALVVNAGLTSSVIAVAGDVHQLDAIIQVNAFFDVDSVDAAFPGSQHNPLGTTTTYNVASFIQETLENTSDAAHQLGVMPANWQVSMVAGDVVFVEWLSQFIFSSDQDLSVLTSTGTTTLVTSGENVGLNSVKFVDIGLQYDLILIGGNLYDANVIVQTNILYDNDMIRSLSGEQDGSGTLNTSGNLLWNQASIHNVGPAQYQSELPDHFEAAMDGLDDGDLRMPTGFATDGLFEGTNMLKVLYIAGDVYDLRYVEQTNILGDADFVATQQASLLADHPQTEWDISTGSNALVNVAAIKDFDGTGDTSYAGGTVYSDAILIQADILATNDSASPGDSLVTEVVAFLDVDVDLGIGATYADDAGIAQLSNEGPPVDVMQSVLA
tara:strand:- start:1224 stop:3236 length:2013 start_codon:yes stop_codon:yes gene_type:complete